jgi:exopolysaccharide production protein ExoQ
MTSLEHLTNNRIPAAEFHGVSRYLCLVTVVLSVAMVGLNHDFDVVGGRFEEPVTSGGGLDQQAEIESGAASFGLGRKIGLIALLATAGLALIGTPAQGTVQLNFVTALAGAAFAWTAASFVWSDVPHETMRELLRLAIFTLTALLLVRRFHTVELVWMMLALCLISIGVDVAADVAAGTFQPWTSEFRLGGTLHPNHLARLGVFVALIGYAAVREMPSQRWLWCLVGFGVVVVLFTVSRSGLLALVVGIAAIHLLGLPARRFAFYTTAVATLLALAMLTAAVMPPSLQRETKRTALMNRTEDVGSLTGRMPLWQEMWRDAAGHRLTGYGYGAYWTAERNYELGSILQWYPRHSHSIYMELLIDLGFIGLGLVLLLTLASIVQYSQLARITRCFEYRLIGAIFVAAMANGFFEIGFLHPRFEGLFMGMAVFVLILRDPAALVATNAMHSTTTEAAWHESFTRRSTPLLGDA